MNPDLEADTDELRRTASEVTATAARIAAGTAAEPPHETVPRWVSSDAALLAADAARQHLAQLGGDIADTARRISAAAEQYELADARAAIRLRLTR